MSGGRNRKSILGDGFEALVGAIFKDSDYYTAKNVALKLLLGKINKLEEIEGTGDYKTVLQEFVQGKHRKMPEYKLVNTKGPDHDKIFESWVFLREDLIWSWKWSSKKKSQEDAAQNAYLKYNK